MSEVVARFILKWRRWLLALVCLLTVAATIPASRVQFDNAIEIWFLDNDPGLATYKQFSERFQADEIAVLGIFHDDVFSAPVLSIVDRITAAAAELDNVDQALAITNSVLASRLDDGFRDAAFRDTIMASPALNGTLVSPEGNAVAIVVSYAGTDQNVKLKYRFVEALEAIAERETRDSSVNFALTGAPVMGKEGQVKNQEDMAILAPLMLLLIVVIAYTVFRSVWLSLLPLAVVTIAVIWSFAMIGILGWSMTMISAMLMPLILAVGVADTIHVVARYRRQLENETDRREAVRASLKQLLKPCFYTTVTTMIALLALLVSEIGPVRQFGVVAAAGVLAAFIVSITLVPAVLVMLPAISRGSSARRARILSGFLQWANRQSRRRPGMIVSLMLILVVSASWLASRVTVGLDPLTWFPDGDPFRVATQRVDEAFGGSLSMEFMVSSPAGNLNDPAILRRLESLEDWLLEQTAISRTFSIAGMVKEAARISRDEGAAGYALPRSQFVVDALLDSMQRSGQLDGWVQPDYTSARISARIPVAGTREIVEQGPDIREYLQTEFDGEDLQVQVTGHAVLVAQMQDYVIQSQVMSFSVALIAISLLMILLLRSLLLGILAMIPNLIPIVAGVGAMTLTGVALNPGTVMITAVALGIVVDDTVHFMTALKRELRHSTDISLATERTINEVGPPVMVTSVLLVLGFSVLLFGSFLPSQQIGGISAFIIVVALLADLILLPAALRLMPARLLS